MLPGTPPPDDLCEEHARIWKAWRDNHYDWRAPSEWPGGGFIMDNRTSHEAREADWDRKNRGQMEQTEHQCRSGRSPQCTRTPPSGLGADQSS